jgi:invasion protein IalB
MSVTIRSFVVLLALAAFPFAALGQTTTTEPEAAETTAESDETAEPNAEEAEGSGPSDLSMGTSADEDAVGRTYVKEAFADWELRCIRTENGNDPCQLYQLLSDQNDNPVAEINLFTVSGGGDAVAGANIITPLETLLTASLRLAVDGGNSKVYPFAFCRRIGCFARVGLTQAEIDQFQKGVEGKILIVPAAAPDQQVILSVSLAGFTAGWKALQAANTSAAAE